MSRIRLGKGKVGLGLGLGLGQARLGQAKTGLCVTKGPRLGQDAVTKALEALRRIHSRAATGL